MRFAYVYFMRDAPDRVRATVPQHAAYWRDLGLVNYQGGPFADRSGGLIMFEAETQAEAERLASGDPFLGLDLLERHWIKEWVPD